MIKRSFILLNYFIQIKDILESLAVSQLINIKTYNDILGIKGSMYVKVFLF